MMPLTDKEADFINYLYKHRGRPPYAMEIMRELNIPKRTVYRNLESLRQKGIVDIEEIGRMKLYRLTDKWKNVAEAAKTGIIAETDEAIISYLLKLIDSSKYFTNIRKIVVTYKFEELGKFLEKNNDLTTLGNQRLEMLKQKKELEIIGGLKTEF